MTMHRLIQERRNEEDWMEGEKLFLHITRGGELLDRQIEPAS